MSLAAADEVARLLTEHPLYGNPRFQPVSDDPFELEGVEVIPGLLYRYPQYDASFGEDGPEVRLNVYLGLGYLGTQLWEREARVLHRIGSLGHPALPEFLDSGQVPAGANYRGEALGVGAGFIRSTSLGISAGDNGGLDLARRLHGDRLKALWHFWQLADALSLLHDSRIVHQNLWPGTLETGTGPDGEPVLKLSRFEMSTIIRNLLSPGGITARDSIRKLYREQPPRHRFYAAPELQAFLEEQNSGGEEVLSAAVDVFALGMMATEWFVGPDTVPMSETTPDAVRAAQQKFRAALSQSLSVPRGLQGLLKDMTEPLARERRITMSEIAHHIGSQFTTLTAEVVGDYDTPPHVVAYMEGPHSDQTLLDHGYISSPSDSEEGAEQIKELIALDMKGAQVFHSATGASGFVAATQSTSADLHQAKTVIYGRDLVWFCSPLHQNRAGGRVEVPNVRLIRYVLPREHADMHARLQELRGAGPRRFLFGVRPIGAFKTRPARLESLARAASKWDELVRTTRQLRLHSAAGESYLSALNWYLEFQVAQVNSRTYAYRIDTASGTTPGTALLRWDAQREAERRTRGSAVLRKYLANSKLRIAMVDHFDEAAAEAGGSVVIQVLADRNGSPGEAVSTCRFRAARGLESIEVDTHESRSLPPIGWIRMRSDIAGLSNISRQTIAVAELGSRRLLVEQLVNPRGGQLAPQRWAHAGGTLQGEGRTAVQEILSHETMFALQGPPGTGKTEVTSQAVVDHLTLNPTARILVSAQSHDALDNLAARILRKLDILDAQNRPQASNWIALRAASEQTRDRVADPLIPFDLGSFADRLVDQARTQSREWLTSGRIEDPALAATLGRWAHTVDQSVLDLRTRARRAANLIFATTGAATATRMIEEYGATEPFDWVLVEEAAKAWPTELALPLVRGLRWTLIGDQAQIGAFNRRQVEDFLLGCNEDPVPEVADWYERRDEFIRGFETFATMFTLPSPRPRMELTEQYRMHSKISAVVSQGFYADRERGGLRTLREDSNHGLTTPDWIQDQPLVWINTDPVQQAEGYWSNDYEAELVSVLIRSMRPRLGGRTGQRTLAVVTPYRKQRTLLQGLLFEHALNIHTIDAFQGREADVVVASLVRDQDPPPGRAYATVGHLAEPARANVMFSRARELLVVVGRLPIYRRTGVPEWDHAVDAILEHALVVPASEVLHK